MASVFKQCTSCRRLFDERQWTALPLCGLQEDGRGGALELRTCDARDCGSTLAVARDRTPAGERAGASRGGFPTPVEER